MCLIDFVLDNKIFSIILISNLILNFYCFNSNKNMFNNIPVNLVIFYLYFRF